MLIDCIISNIVIKYFVFWLIINTIIMKIRPSVEVWSSLEISLNSRKIKRITFLVYFCLMLSVFTLITAVILFV